MLNKTSILGFATVMMGACEMNQEKWKQDILDEWEKSKNYPRKKKKKVRKHLQLDWNFACWNPIEEMMNHKF